MRSRVRSVIGVLGAFALLALVPLQANGRPLAAGSVEKLTATHQCLVMTGSGDPAFVRNFNPYTATGLPSGAFVRGVMYEPLIITTMGAKLQVPWLAKSWTWSKDAKTLTLNIRQGVKWSDGKTMTADDVVYSLTAGKQDPVMDLIGYNRPESGIVSIAKTGPYAVAIKLKAIDSQFIAAILNRQFVVPKHVFSQVKDVATWTNSNPVSSGPFPKIGRFTTQDYVLLKNAHYWKPGSPKIACVEYIQAASNDSALLLIQSGQVDWTHNFVPNVEKAYIAKDKAHYHAFYAKSGYPVGLMLDTTKYPYSMPAFRQALSMAIDRNTVVKLGEYGYAPTADALGLSALFPQWVTDKKVIAEAKRLSTFNQTAAKKLLTDNGFTYKDNKLIDPKGNPVAFDLHVISGWSDWVASLQIITKNLQGIGINTSTKLEPDWGSWYPNAASTKTPTLLWQTASTGSPYGYFWSNMSHNSFVASGEDATNTGNWIHYWNSTATKLLDEWKGTLNVKAQHRAATELQKLWLQKMPMVPLFIGPRWSTYSTKYFHCFQNEKNFYADPIFTTFPDNIVQFNNICPGGTPGV